MTVFRDGRELEQLLIDTFETFLASGDAERAAEVARERPDSFVAVLRTADPEVVLSIDLGARAVNSAAATDPAIEIQIEADDLHNLLLERLDPVQISRLYETDSLLFSGDWADLGGLVVLATPMGAAYTEALTRRERRDLLDTPLPPTRVTWSSDEPPRELIGHRRPWQRLKPQRA